MKQQMDSERDGRWRGLILARRATVIGALLLTLCALPASGGEGEFYIGEYNKLVKMTIDRCRAANVSTAGLYYKDADSSDPNLNSLRQSDLNFLRSMALSLMSSHYVLNKDPYPDATATNIVSQAFPFGLRRDTGGSLIGPTLMTDIGQDGHFTKIPADCVSSGAAVFSDDFTNAPLLWVHFDELDRTLKRMKYTTTLENDWTTNAAASSCKNIFWTSFLPTWDSAKGEAITNYPFSDVLGPVSPRAHWVGIRQGYYAVKSLSRACARIEVGLATGFSSVVYFYSHARVVTGGQLNWTSYNTWDSYGDDVVENQWKRWDAKPAGPMDTEVTSAVLGDPGLSRPDPPCDEPEEDDAFYCRGYFADVGLGIIEWTFADVCLSNPEQDDSEEDGLVETGCECQECLPNADATWQNMRACPRVKVALGVSSGLATGGLRVKAYMSEYRMANTNRQMFSLDTAVLSNPANATEGWEFVVVKRPSGAEVLFSMKGAKAHKAANMEKSYGLFMSGSDYEIKFGGKMQVFHRFDATNWKIKQVRATPENEEISISGSSTSWPGMTTFKSGSLIVSNVCPIVVALPTYSGNLISAVAYKDSTGRLLSTITITNGSRIFISTDGSGNQTDKTRVITTTNSVELWKYGQSMDDVAQKEIREESYDSSNDVLTVTETTIYDPTGANDCNVTVRIMGRFSWGYETATNITGSDGANPLVSTYSYYTNSVDTANYSRLKQVENSDGSWTRYEYDFEGRETVICSAFKNSSPTAATNECRVTRYFYATNPILTSLNFPADDVVITSDTRPRLVIEEVLGQEVSRSFSAYLPDRQVSKRCLTSGAAYDATNNQVTSHFSYTNGTYEGRPWKIENSDGTLSVYTYGYNNSLKQLATTNRSGSGSGSTVTNGTEPVTLIDAGNRTISSLTRDIASQLTLSSAVYSRDAFGRVTCVSNVLDGSYTTNVLGCCGPEYITDTEGILTEQTYDDLKRVVVTERQGILTSHDFDSFGNAIQTTRSASGETAIVTASVFDKAGRLITSTNELGQTTTYSYSTNSSGEEITTTTYPDNSYRVETSHRDGQIHSITGTAVSPICYDYGVCADGMYTIEYRGTDTSATEWVKTVSDRLGRTIRTEYPDGFTVANAYNSKGQLVSTTQNQAPGTTNVSITEYTELGEAFRSGVDINGNGALDLDGTDRISESQSSYTTFNGTPVREAVSRVYPTNGSSTTLTLLTSRTSVQNLESWSVSFGGTNHTIVTRDRSTASRTETTTRPDGTQTISCFTNNLLMSVANLSSVSSVLSVVNYSYDGFNRLSSMSEPAANGETRVTTYGYNAAGVATNLRVSVPSVVQDTSFVLDSMGRRTATILPDGGAVTNTYSTRGELLSQSGARTYPVTYTYTDQGRMQTMSTYREGLTGDPDVTMWSYDTQRGWMTCKTYADGSTNGYSYRPDGKVTKKTGARGIETLYSFDAAGSLTNVNYSDSTPDVTYMLDRLGRVVTITDGIGVHTNLYNTDGTVAGVADPGGIVLAYTRDALGRMTNLSLSLGGSAASRTGYTFDNAGRLSSVSDGTHEGVYTYASDGATWTNLSFGAALSTRRTFDGLNRLSSISSVPSVSSVVSFSYTLNAANQRTASTLADSLYWLYGYNERGEVISGKKYFADATPVGGAQFGYEFDTIGNRVQTDTGAGSTPAAYTANELNQYTVRDVPGVVEVTGTASNQAVVSVRDGTNTAQLANRHQDYFWKDVDVDNAGALFSSTNIQVTARLTQGTQSLVRTESRSAILPQTPEAFAWDPDGNLSSDSLWTNQWDAENRMVMTESRTAVPAAFKKRLTFQHDYMGRRTVKQVESGYTGGTYSTTNTTTYVWDGFKIVAEMGQGHTNVMTYGADLSGSLSGAAGIGGLLWMTLGTSGTYCVAYNGNGDVMALVSADDGTIGATYEYGVFAETLRADGPVAKANPMRYSTRPYDDETGLYSWPERDYSPVLGEWLSQDRVHDVAHAITHSSENNGAWHSDNNLHVFMGNAAITVVDPLGDAYGNPVPSLASVATPLTGTCGPEVNRAVAKTLLDIARTYDSWSWPMKRCKCEALIKVPSCIYAWDIEPLYLLGKGDDSELRGGTGDFSRTVSFRGNCYNASAVNYSMWGMINSLCNSTFGPVNDSWTLKKAVQRTRLYKAILYGGAQSDQAVAFTKYGYNGTDPKSTALLGATIDPSVTAIENKYGSYFVWRWDILPPMR